MQRERRRDPYPWSWEIPVAAMIAVAAVIVLGIQLGRSTANLLAGAGWTWPAADTGPITSPIGTAFWSSLPDVLAGDAGAGLPGPAPDRIAGAGLLWTFLVVTEILLLALAAWASVATYQRWGPGRMRGMATTAEAEKLLGVTRLRKVSALVRPDLHSGHTRREVLPHHRIATTDGDPTSLQIGRGLSNPWLRRSRRRD